MKSLYVLPDLETDRTDRTEDSGKNAIKSRIAPGLLILCLIVLSFQSFASAEALAKDPYEDWIWEPFVEND